MDFFFDDINGIPALLEESENGGRMLKCSPIQLWSKKGTNIISMFYHKVHAQYKKFKAVQNKYLVLVLSGVFSCLPKVKQNLKSGTKQNQNFQKLFFILVPGQQPPKRPLEQQGKSLSWYFNKKQSLKISIV